MPSKSFLSFAANQPLIEALDAAAKNFPGLSRSALIRNVLSGWLHENGFLENSAGVPRKSPPAGQGGGADFARRSRRIRLED